MRTRFLLQKMTSSVIFRYSYIKYRVWQKLKTFPLIEVKKNSPMVKRVDARKAMKIMP